MDKKGLLELAVLREPATIEQILATQKEVNFIFLQTYKDLLGISNGMQVLNHVSLTLYSTEEIMERNETFQVDKYLPSYLLIGDDGAGQGVYLDKQSVKGTIYRLGLGNPYKPDAILLGEDIEDWVKNNFDLKDDDNEYNKYPEKVDVYMTKIPADKNKSFLLLREALNLNISYTQMKTASNTLPYRLLHSVPFWKYAKICAKINEKEKYLTLTEVDNFNNHIMLPSYLS